jgi:hypothetical protein
VDTGLAAEHQSEFADGLDQVDAVPTPLVAHAHHHLSDTLTTMDGLARGGGLVAAFGDVDVAREASCRAAGRETSSTSAIRTNPSRRLICGSGGVRIQVGWWCSP